jgi:O-antigen/teichoic acid export membrane protein
VTTDPRDRGRQARERLTGGRLLARNTLITIVGQGLIVVTAIAAVPLLIDMLGTARFGVLTLAWVLIGYAGLFDLGLGRALTKFTAEKLGAGEEEQIPPLFWTAFWLLGALGVVAGAIVAGLSPWLTKSVLNIPEDLEGEALAGFGLLALSIPFVLGSASLRGNLEAHQRFDLTNATAVPLSVISYFGPVLAALVSHHLAVVIAPVVLSRVLACGILLHLCQRVDPSLAAWRTPDRRLVSPLLRFGGWITATSIVAPLFSTLDRFMVGAVASATAVAYYATPYEAVVRLRIISMSFAGVLFPAFAATVASDRARSELLFSRGSRGVLIALFPLSLITLLFGHEILDLWVGQDFADASTEVMQWLSAGVLLNGLAFMPFSLLQSTRPDLIAKVLAAELPFYLLGFWLGVDALGIEGGAIAWTVRVGVDGAILYGLLYYHLKLISGASVVAVAKPLALCIAMFLVAPTIDDVALKAAFFVAAMVAFGLYAWYRVLERDERDVLRRRLHQAVNRAGSRRKTFRQKFATLGRGSSQTKDGV